MAATPSAVAAVLGPQDDVPLPVAGRHPRRRRRLLRVSQPGDGSETETLRGNECRESDTTTADGQSEDDPQVENEQPSTFEDPVDVAP